MVEGDAVVRCSARGLVKLSGVSVDSRRQILSSPAGLVEEFDRIGGRVRVSMY